jgi:hypothetical protein
MHPTSSRTPASPASGLWHHPARAAAWTFALGTLASTGSLGIFAILVEGQAYLPGSTAAGVKHAALLSAWVLANASGWGALMYATVSERDNKGGGMLGAFSVLAGLVTLGLLVSGGDHQGRPSLSPGFGMLFAVMLDGVRNATFGPIRALAQQAQRGDGDPLEAATAGSVWSALISAYGILLAPGPYSAAPSVLGAVASCAGLVHIFLLARSRGEGPPHAGMTMLRGLTMGGTFAVVLGLVLVPLRLHEQSVTRNPAVLAIYHHKQGRYGACEVKPAGREGDVSLWQLDCHGGWAPVVGWDERRRVALDEDELYERVPRVRPR